jgi:hypothetical protein
MLNLAEDRLRLTSFLFLLLFIAGCAGQVAPSGGPVDTTPPTILSTYPANYSTGFNDRRVIIEFDEYVVKSSVEGAIFVSPRIDEIEFDWSGREVEIKFGSPLRMNTTYVINIGSDVVDLRNKNRMAEAFTLAFSTGTEIDRGVISGRVFPMKDADKPEGVMIFGYALSGRARDTLNPLTHKPDYVTQSGKDGRFTLSHLSLGDYRIVAVRDEFRNLLYDPENDEYAVTSKDIRLTETDTSFAGLNLKLAKEDTTAPRLLKITVVNRNQITAEFSEPLDTATVLPSRFQIVDTLNQRPLEVRVVSAILPKTSEISMVTEEQVPSAPYRLRVNDVTDLVGIPMHPLANTLGFEGSTEPDTVAPVIKSFSIRDSSRGAGVDATLLVYFSEPVKAEATEVVSFVDSSKAPFPFAWRWLNAMSMEVKPAKRLQSKAWYSLAVSLRKVWDLNGNRGADTVRVLRFETIDIEQLSSIEGIVVDRSADDSTGGVFVIANNVSRKEAGRYRVNIPRPGRFEITEIPEGQYVLEAFRDRNNNLKYDAGKPFPHIAAERFAVYPDTLKLRARWPLDGVRIELK